MLLNLLESTSQGSTGGGWGIWIIFGVAIVAMIVMNHFQTRKERLKWKLKKKSATISKLVTKS
jgi:hypothetical protein